MHNKLLTKYYFINKFDTNYIDKQDKQTAIIYRNYNIKIDLNLIGKIQKYCKFKNYKFFLANNIKFPATGAGLGGVPANSISLVTRFIADTVPINLSSAGAITPPVE